jgi:hypothetical protein
MPKMVALDKNGVLVELLPKKGPGYLQILMVAKNNTLETLEQYLFQVSCLGRFKYIFKFVCFVFFFLILARVTSKLYCFRRLFLKVLHCKCYHHRVQR